MAVAEVDGLLYLPGHTRQQLLRALRIPALSPGWQSSFRALLDGERGSGNAGLAVTSPPPAWPGFRRLTVTAIAPESDSVVSIRLEDPEGGRVPAARPGQYLTLRVQPDEAQRPLLRNYSLSGPPAAASTGSPSSASTTAPPASTCTPGSPSATSSTSPRPAARSSSIGRTRRCC